MALGCSVVVQTVVRPPKTTRLSPAIGEDARIAATLASSLTAAASSLTAAAVAVGSSGSLSSARATGWPSPHRGTVTHEWAMHRQWGGGGADVCHARVSNLYACASLR